MKLLAFALFSCISAGVARAQETDRAWVSLDRDIQELSAAKATSLVIYDVRDIAESMNETLDEGDQKRAELEDRIARFLTRQELSTRTVTQPDGTLMEELVDPARDRRIERGAVLLTKLIKENLEPGFDARLHSINVAGPGSLAIVATAKQHEWLARFFSLAQRTTDLVQIETRWVSGPRGSFERLGLSSSSTLPTQAEFAALLKQLEEDKDGDGQFDQLMAPRLIARNLQRSSISALDQIAYIKEWHVTFVQPGPQEIADPVIETINAGETLNVRSVRIDENLFRLALEVEHVAVAQPIPTKKVRVSVAPGGEAEIGLPVVARVHFSADVKLASGAAAVLMTPLDDKQDLVLIIRLLAVPNENAPPIEPPPAKDK